MRNFDDKNMEHMIMGLAVKTEEEYVLWVRTWKKFHAELIARIHGCRDAIAMDAMTVSHLHGATSKRAIKIRENAIRNMATCQCLLAYYKEPAHTMYDARVKMKANLKAGKYPSNYVKTNEAELVENLEKFPIPA